MTSGEAIKREERERSEAIAQRVMQVISDHLITDAISPELVSHFSAIGEDLWKGVAAVIQQEGLGRECLRHSAVTEQMEELSRAKDEAERANKAKSEFLANVSHEIRTPMNAILGLTDQIIADTELSKGQKGPLEIIQASGDQLLALINDLIDLSRIDIGEIEIAYSPFSLHKLINRAKSMVGVLARKKKLKVNVTIGEDVPNYVLGDDGRIFQILTNLINNAVKYTEKGEINVIASMTGDKPSQFHFCICDTGGGIPEERLGEIFEPFTQVDGSVTRRKGGTGLGLSICQKLIDLMEGRIWVESEVDEGSNFHFKLPLDLQTDEVKKNFLHQERLRRKGLLVTEIPKGQKVLLVEDNKVNQLVAKTSLRKLKCKVDVAENGKVAVEMIQQSVSESVPYDLIFMDCQMPEMDGYEATRLVREAGIDISIIAMTAHAMKGDEERCLAAGDG